MRAEIVHDMVKRDTEMLHKRNLRSRLIIERYRLIEYAEVACLLDVCNCSEDKPHWIIIESASDIVVSAFRKRLILMVAASVRELGRSNVDDPLSRALRNLMHEAYEVLIRVTEAHSTADSALEERS